MLRLLSPSLPDLQVLSCPERGRGGVKMMLLVLVLSGDVGPGALRLDGLGPDGLGPDGLDPDGLGLDGLGPDGLGPDGLGPDGLGPDGLVPGGLGPRDIGLGPGGCDLGQIKLFHPTL